MKTVFLCNPMSGSGRGQAMADALTTLMPRYFPQGRVEMTRGPGATRQQAITAAEEGAELVVAVGGDGTLGDVVDGLMALPEGHRSAFSFIAAGSGSDFARNFPRIKGPEAALSRLASATGRPMDVGRVTYSGAGGTEERRHFINIASLGLSAETAEAINAAKLSGRKVGSLTYLTEGLRSLFNHRSQRCEVLIDDRIRIEMDLLLAAVANGKWFGGGMKIAPNADIFDGFLEVVLVEKASRLSLISAMGSLYAGTHVTNPRVKILQAKDVKLRALAEHREAVLETDGESQGPAACHFSVLSGALTIRI